MKNGSIAVVGLTPLERADAPLAVALQRAGARAVLDLGRDESSRAVALSAIAAYSGRSSHGFGVRVPMGVQLNPESLPDCVDLVVVPSGSDLSIWLDRSVWVEVTSVQEARVAAEAGATGLIAKGHEAGGRVGDETSFVLLQRLIVAFDLPVWVQGGIGRHTAAACAAGGAAGVVLDSQLALARESTLPAEVKAVIAGLDGSETVVRGGHRLFTRPDLPVAELPEDISAAEVGARLGGCDLRTELLPLGQDAAFAKPLADRFVTAGGIVQAIRCAVVEHLELAQELRPLSAGSSLADAHGLRYPIAQGPMTRVSDRAAFAEAVARAGGLPFLALSLLTGPAARKLLTETAELLGDLPWGAGLLGFAPPEIREAQLEALREVRPPVALIAGGRPSQAKPLEDIGISTYLHAPSPGLLELFVKQGARKFVFEGRECGGHVGPRSSFALWEAQIDRLLAAADSVVAELHLLFAGGIHDARSAAMVSALVAPLAARGARIGVIMGTAYLFTHEAVSSGAILPRFQSEAAQCDKTVLLETAPGHASRCVDTPFVGVFDAEKARLQADGRDPKEAWEELERLNVGRLRIAAKGVIRRGDELIDVGDDEQRSEGMYMVGQVAALRDGTCSMAELHSDVCDGATAVLDRFELDDDEALPGDASPTEIAIVGMACIFPGATDLTQYWSNIVNGRNDITEVSPDRWDPSLYYDPNATGANINGKTPSKWGGFLPPTVINPLDYGIPPKSFGAIEPVQLLSLEVATRALRDAGYADREFPRERASVIFGAEAGTEMSGAYGFRAMYPQVCGPISDDLHDALPTLTEDSFPGVLANVIAGRIANRLDFGGVNYTVDAACASSLAAVDLAVKELSSGTSDMVLCGGADLHNSINDYLLFASVHALSPSGQCRTFDANADGICLGEGVACVVLKRLSDAERDGDRIYAVIRGIAGSSDGRSLGLTAPRKDGQKRALTRAYRRSGVAPSEVGLVEAHGTGTVVGDRTELATLTEVYEADGAQPGTVALGSVKTQIGHTKCAAGMAAMIKAALALHNGVRPPTLHIDTPNPGWNRDTSPFEFCDTSRPWPADRKRAALSALGFGGTNFHAVMAGYDGGSKPEVGVDEWPAELVVFRGVDRAAATERMAQLEKHLAGAAPVRLRDLARSLAADVGPIQVAVVAADCDELQAILPEAKAFRGDGKRVFVVGEAQEGKVAFLFPGQGSQRPGMLADLFVTFPQLQELLEYGADYVERIYPPSPHTPGEQKAQREAIKDTRVAQPALGMVDRAMARLLQRFGVSADMLAGHSYGELVALCTAGAFDERELVALSAARADCILGAAGDDPGTMAAVSAPADKVEAAVASMDDVIVANYNAPRQAVISGGTAAVERAVELLKEQGMAAKIIPVACAFHSSIVAGARESFAERLSELCVRDLSVPVWANSSAAPYPADAVGVRETLAGQVALPVRFSEQIQQMYDAGARVFVEVGPGRVLSGLVGKILGDQAHVAIPCDEPGKPGVPALLHALARLVAAGVEVDVAALFAGRDAALIALDKPPVGLPKAAWLVDGHKAKPVIGEPPKGSYRPISQPVAVATAAVVSTTTESTEEQMGQREQTVVEFLRTMREMVSAQRDVLLGYLGTAPVQIAAQPLAAPALVASSPAPVATVAALTPVEAVVPAPAPAEDPAEVLLAIVSERTGYPIEMLELDLDLEAELSIDSIKRIEILGELRERVGLEPPEGQTDEEVVEQLAALKTLRGIIEWLSENNGSKAGASDPTVAPASSSPAHADSSVANELESPATVVQTSVDRYLLRVCEAPPPALNGTTLDRRRFAITDDGRGIAEALAEVLGSNGAQVHILAPNEGVGEVDGLIHLGSLAEGAGYDSVKRLFHLAKEALLGGAEWIMAATPLGGQFGRTREGHLLGGNSGMVKTIAREWPDARVRVVDVDPTEAPALLAKQFRAEMLAIDDYLEIGYASGTRYELKPEPVSREDGAPLELDDQSVVLVTGGARGITASAAVELARRYRCRLELVGRSPLPELQQDAATAAAGDALALRKLLVSNGLREPAAIEAEVRRILGARQIHATLKAIREAGSEVTYHATDVRNDGLFGSLIDSIYAERGRLDGVIHGAGILEDKLLRDKTDESFARVFDTKLNGALTIARKVRQDVKFVAFFSSISGAFGNRGQVDYSAANDALDKLARSLDHRLPGRVVAINWGPWGGTGMVSAELEREYQRRGIGLIPLDTGIDRLIDELRPGGPDCDSQVVLMCADPEQLMARPRERASTAPSAAIAHYGSESNRHLDG